MKIPAFITVRSSSTRLPEKCFLPFGEGSVLEHIIKRVRHYDLDPIICTTIEKSDDPIVELAKKCNVKFYFEVEGSDDIKILRPKKPFKVKAGKMVKKVVVLRTEKKLANDSKKDTPIHVIIKAFAVDDEEKIIVHRNTVFFYPRADQFNK